MKQKVLSLFVGSFFTFLVSGFALEVFVPSYAPTPTQVADFFSTIGLGSSRAGARHVAASLDRTFTLLDASSDALRVAGDRFAEVSLQSLNEVVASVVRSHHALTDSLVDSLTRVSSFAASVNESSDFVVRSSALQTASLLDTIRDFFWPSMDESTVDVTTTPQIAPIIQRTSAPSPTSSQPISRAQILQAVQDFFRQGVPVYIAEQLRGPKGDTGATGVAGPAGYSVGSVVQTTSGGSVGTIGGVTYFGAKGLSTETLNASGTTTLASLTVSGAATLNGALTAGATTLSSLTVSGTATLNNFTVTQLDVDGSGSVSGTFEAGYLKGDATQADLAHIGDSTYRTVQHMQTVYHSTGWVSGGDITNNGGGAVTVSAGTGLIRDSNNSLAVLAFFDWPASGSFTLRDNATNYIFVDYNSGSPIIRNLSSDDTSNTHSRFLLAKIVRVGSTIYLNDQVKPQVGDHAGLMIREMMGTMPYANAGGAEIMANMMNPVAFDISEGTWWNGLNKFTTPAFTGDTDVFSYYYHNGSGGWTEVTDQTQIDTTHYDNASGTLATLDANDYGVHWIYLATNGDVSVVYGSSSYTLNEAQNATEPTDIPLQLEQSAFIAGKIIVRKSASSLTDVNAVSMMQRRFPGSPVADHNSLLGLLGGTTDEYYHLTSSQYTRLASASSTLSSVGNCSSGTAQKLLYNATTGAFTCGVDQNTGGGGSSNLFVREFRGGGYGGYPASLSFDPGKFDLTASGASDVTISLDWTNGPASRSAAQTITGNWIFSGSGLGLLVTTNASVSGNFELVGTLQAGSTTITGTASISSTLEAAALRSLGLSSDTSLTINPTTTLSITPGSGLTAITGRASVSSNMEISGFASASKYFGAGLTTCTADAQNLQYNSSIGVFSCATGALARVYDGNAFVTNLTHDFHFDAGAFNVTASGVIDAFLQLDYTNGPASRAAAQTITGAWNFTGGASVSTNAFEVGPGVFYVSPTSGRVGINTQNLSQALEVVGNASLSGTFTVLGNTGIGAVSPDARLRITGATSDNTLSTLTAYDSSGTQLLDIRNDGISAIGAAANAYATFAVNGRSVTGSATLSTTGSSTTVTTTGGAFADIQHDARLTANGTSVWVVEKVDNNTLLVDPAVDWSAGYAFTYRNPTLITANGDSTGVKGFSWGEDGAQTWQMYTWGDEQSHWLHLWSYANKSDVLTISEAGRLAVNFPTTLADQEDVSSTLALYPQSFAAVYFYKNSNSSYTDFTSAAANSADANVVPLSVNVDYVYIGMNRKFGFATFELDQAYVSGATKVEFWNGSAWVTMSSGAHELSDGTQGLTRSGDISWNQDLLSGWAKTTVNGDSYYWVRGSLTSLSGTLSVRMLTPSTAWRLAAFKAQEDVNPSFVVDTYGRTALGNRVTANRLDDTLSDPHAFNIIDTSAVARLWSFSNSPAGIELYSGAASASDAYYWEIEMASVSELGEAEGVAISRKTGGTETTPFFLGNTNVDGSSRTTAILNSIIGDMNGSDAIRGLELRFTNGSHAGLNNEIRGLDVGSIGVGDASQSAIVVGSGWDYAFIASQGSVGIGTESPNYLLEVAGTASISQFYGAGLSSCTADSDRIQYNATTGQFSCVYTTQARLHEGDALVESAPHDLHFVAGAFNITASGSNDGVINLDYTNGPASRAMANTWTARNVFSAGASISTGLEVSGTASVSAIKIGGTTFSPASYLALAGGALSGQLTGTYASLSANFEVSGYASVSQLFGAGLSSCDPSTGKLTWSNGRFVCGSDSGAAGSTIRIEQDGVAMQGTATRINFLSSAFLIVASGSTEGLVDLSWGAGGPASLSQDELVTGHWRFVGAASASDAFEISGAASASTLFGAGLSSCSGAGQKLLWASGLFTCGTDNSGGGSGSGSGISVRVGFTGSFALFASFSFEPGGFNFDTSNADGRIALDYVNGPASRSIAQTITALWTFTAGASVSGTLEATTLKASQLNADSGLTIAPTSGLTNITGRASVSSNFEVSGYASASQLFGAGLTNCTGAFNVLRWNSSTGLFTCGTEGGGLRSESSQTTVVTDNSDLSFDAGQFSLTASGTTETLIKFAWGTSAPASRAATNTWTALNTFSGGVSISSNPFEVGSNTLYVSTALNYVGVNTQHLEQALEVSGVASVSGNITTLSSVGVGTMSPGAKLDVIGSARIGSGTHVNQTVLDVNVGHALNIGFRTSYFGVTNADGLAIKTVATDDNIFTVYGSQSAQIISLTQADGSDSRLIAMSNSSLANYTAATQGILINKGSSHDIALQYQYGNNTPVDGLTLDVNPTSNVINAVVINNDNQSMVFRVAGQNDVNLIYADGSRRVGIGTSAPLTKLEVQGTASASYLLTTGSLQVAGGASVSYSRFGTTATTRTLSASNDLLINGKFEVDSQVFLDAAASVAANFEVGGSASVSGTLNVLGLMSFVNASGSGVLELTDSSSKLGINAGSTIDAMLEVGGTALISGKVTLSDSASVAVDFEVIGIASVASLRGAGLRDCDNPNQKLLWTASGSSAGQFSCGYDGIQSVQVFSAGAAQTWTRPASVSQVYVEVWGAGGGGGTAGGNNSRGGGGGGGYSAGLVTVTGNVTVNVGTGGTAGNTGGDSSFAGATTPTGSGGVGTSAATGGAGGAASGGTINISGGTGANGWAADGASGGAGGGSPMGGAGGGGGSGGNAANPGVAGKGGTIPGGGGGGGSDPNGTGGSGADGRVIVWAYAGTSRSDIAEWYETDGSVAAGDIVTMGPETFTYTADTGTHTVGVLTKAMPGDTVFGVVSTYPEIFMGKDILATARHPQPIVLAGRVPVAVTGSVKVGDILKLSSLPGVAQRTDKAGSIIGSAMESYDGPEGSVGRVMVYVQTGYSTGSRMNQVLARHGVDMDEIPENADVGKIMLAQLLSERASITGTIDISEVFTDRVIAGLEVITPRVITDAISVDTLEPTTRDIMIKLSQQGVLSIGDGVTIDALGNATFAGTISAAAFRGELAQVTALASRTFSLESLMRQTFATLTLADVELSGRIASVSNDVADLQSRLQIAEIHLADLASQSSEGLSFETATIMGGGLRVDSIGAIGDLITFGSDTYFFGRPYFTSDTGGFAVIASGQSEVRVTYDRPYIWAPVVNVTVAMQGASKSEDGERQLLDQRINYIVTRSTEEGFTIRLSAPATSDVPFTWTALAIKDARVFTVTTPTPSPTPTLTPTPEQATPSDATTDDPTPQSVPSESPELTPEATIEATPSPTPEVIEDTMPEPSAGDAGESLPTPTESL